MRLPFSNLIRSGGAAAYLLFYWGNPIVFGRRNLSVLFCMKKEMPDASPYEWLGLMLRQITYGFADGDTEGDGVAEGSSVTEGSGVGDGSGGMSPEAISNSW